MVESLMNDSAPDTREHFSEPANIQQPATSVGARGA